MTVWWIVAIVSVAALVVLLVLVNEFRVSRRARRAAARPGVLAAWPRRAPIDVLEISWDEPPSRKRLGGLGQ